MDNMFQVKQNMTEEQMRKFTEQRLNRTEELLKRDKLVDMSAQEQSFLYERAVKQQEEQKSTVQDMPEQMANEKDYQRVKRHREPLQKQVDKWRKKEEEQKGKERRTDLAGFFTSTLKPEMFTPQYVLEHFAEIKETLEFWKLHLDAIEAKGVEKLKVKEDVLRFPYMKEMYEQGMAAFTSALGALGYEYHPEKKAGSELSEVLGKKKRESFLEQNRKQREAMTGEGDEINEKIADALLDEVRTAVQERTDALRKSTKQNPRYSFIESDKISQIYEFIPVAEAKELMEAHPKQVAQHREQVKELYDELFHLMEAIDVEYQPMQEITEVKDAKNARMLRTDSKIHEVLQGRLDKQRDKREVLRTRAEAVVAGLKFLLTGEQPAEILSYILRDFTHIEDLHQREGDAVKAEAREFVNRQQEIQQNEELRQIEQAKNLWKGENTPEREQELGTLVKPRLAAYLEQLRNFDTRFLENGQPEELAGRIAEAQQLAVTGRQLMELGKVKDPEDAGGRSLLDTLAGENKELLTFKSEMLETYVSRARAYTLAKAYQKGTLDEDAFFPAELEAFRARHDMREGEPLTREQYLLIAKAMLEKAKVSQNTLATAFFKSEKMRDSAEGSVDLKIQTAHPVYNNKIYGIEDICRKELQIPNASVGVREFKQFYQHCEEKIEELSQELEQIEEPGMLSLEIQEQIKQYREYKDYAQAYVALTSHVYKRAGETETPMGEPMFRSYNSVESLPAFRNMSEEDFTLMCKKMSAGALAPDNADPVRQEVYYAENMEGLRMYKEHMREHYEMLEREFHHQVPSIDYIMEHELQMQQWFANTQMDNHIVEGMRDLIDLTNPEDLRLYHLVNYYNAMSGYVTSVHTMASEVVPSYKDAEDALYVVMRNQAFSREYLEQGGEYQPPVEAEQFRQIAADVSQLAGADETTMVRYLQRVTELADYVGRHKDDQSLDMKQYRGWLALIQRRLEPVAMEFHRSVLQGEDHREVLETASKLAGELQSGDVQRMLNAAIEMGKMALTFNMPNLTQEESFKERSKQSWKNCEEVYTVDGAVALWEMPEEFIADFIGQLYQKKEEMVNRMEQEIARVMEELPAEMEEQEKKLLATRFIDETDFAREYFAVKNVADNFFKNEKVLEVAKAYLENHEELLRRTGAMDEQINTAFVKYGTAFTAMGFTTTVGKKYLRDFQSTFWDKEKEAKKANPHADGDSYDMVLDFQRIQGQEVAEDFSALAQKVGTLQVTEEMLKPDYIVSHMAQLLTSFREVDAYQNLLNANPQLEERVPAAVKLAWTKNRGMYEKYREYVNTFIRSKAVNVETGEYIPTETYEAEQEEIAGNLSRQRENIQDLLGGYDVYGQKIITLMNQVKEMKSLDEDERYEILKPLREAGLWLMDLTTYLRQPLDISNEDFFDATIMTLMSMFGYIEKSLHEAIAALVNAPLQKNAGELIGQMREISLKFTEFKEQVPGQAQELRNQILNSGEETPLTLRDIVQSAQVQRTFQLHGEQENVGQGASDVIRVTEGDKVFYFKENEAIKNIRESLWDVLPLLGEVHLNQAVAEFLSRTKEDTPENLEQLKTFYKMVNFLSARGTVNEDMLEYIQQLLPGIDVLQLAQEHADQWRAFAKEVGKKYVTIQSASAKELLLDEGANMTARNYASERVAELLGAKGLIVRNQIAIVREEDGFEKKGFIMEQAQGIPVHQLDREARDKGYEVHMTGDAQKQLLNLQILDNIIGQTDRHTGNYFVDYDVDAENHTFLVKKVTGIDNDFAFGKSLMVGGGNTTSILKEDGTYQYSMIDPEMYENIMTLSPELLETNLENVIERKYIDALKTRFETVREALRKAKEDAEQNGRDFFRKQGGWGEESEQLWMHEAANSYLRRVKRW